jgi:hypothetical protein
MAARRILRGMKLLLALCIIAVAATSPSAFASSTAGCRETAAQQAKPPVRKPPETRERKRTSSVGRGCVGCIMPLDGIASTMAVRSLS